MGEFGGDRKAPGEQETADPRYPRDEMQRQVQAEALGDVACEAHTPAKGKVDCTHTATSPEDGTAPYIRDCRCQKLNDACQRDPGGKCFGAVGCKCKGGVSG